MIRGVVLQSPGELRRTDLPDPGPPGPDQVLVAIRRVGVCGTDLHAYAGRQPFFAYPRILGHEMSAEVVAVGDGVTDVRPGDRCAIRPYLACGRCDPCARGRANACTELTVLGVHIDGGMCERLLVPATAIHPSATLSYDQLALVETLSVGGHAVTRAAPEPGERVLVVGAGPIGLGVAASLRAGGIRPLLADTSVERRAFAEAWADLETVDPSTAAAERIADRLGGPPTLVLDATGNPASMHRSVELVAAAGRVVFVGLFQGDLTLHDPDLHRRELTLLASRNATAADVDRTMAHLGSGAFDPLPWISERVTLAELPEALPRWAAAPSGMIKGLVVMG